MVGQREREREREREKEGKKGKKERSRKQGKVHSWMPVLTLKCLCAMFAQTSPPTCNNIYKAIISPNIAHNNNDNNLLICWCR